MNWLIAAPLLVPLFSAGLGLLAWRRPRLQAAISLAGQIGLVAVAVILVLQVDRGGIRTLQAGGWAAPIGITLAVDALSALLLLLSSVMALAAGLYGLGWWNARPAPALQPLMSVLILGVNGAFMTGDLFNLYVWFEVLLLASFALLALSGGRAGLEGAVKALVLNMIGSLFFLVAVGVVYGLAGTLNLADLHLRMEAIHAAHPTAVMAAASMLGVAFALKAALFPVYFWLPASYHVPAPGICALFAALLTKVGLYSLLRLFTLPFAVAGALLPALLTLTAITMVSGVLGALTRFEIKRILAWHSISQTGYIAAGIGLLLTKDPQVRLLAVTAVVFFLLHHALVKPALFMISGLIARRGGGTELTLAGGLYPARPVLSAAFLLAALSLAGLPPLSGFWAKLAVLRAAALSGQWGLLAAALAAGLMTLLSMLKIWNEAFWKPRPAGETAALSAPRSAAIGPALWGPVLLLLALVAVMGVFPQPVLDLSRRAAAGVLDPQAYVAAVRWDDADPARGAPQARTETTLTAPNPRPERRQR